MKILVIFTGGTIGSTVNENYISLDENKKYALIEEFNKNNDTLIEFETLNPYSIFSENLSGEELTTLCKLVESNVDAGYDGIIVTHGTDTLQYTASALAFTVKTKIPVVLVSANYPSGHKLYNGADNFTGAVRFIEQHKKAGVFISYRNHSPSDVYFYPATRLTTHNEGRDTLYSIDYFPYGIYTKKDAKYEPENSRDKFKLFGEISKINGKGGIGAVEFVKDPKILFLTSHPGDSFNYKVEDYNAVLIKPYHSGTLDTANKNFTEFCKKAKQNDIPIIVPNVFEGVSYDSTANYEELGLIVLPYTAIPATYIKLWLAISLKVDIKEFMLNEIWGEFPKIKQI